jgi:hypothetical protein
VGAGDRGQFESQCPRADADSLTAEASPISLGLASNRSYAAALAALGAAQALHHISEQRIPPCEGSEGLRARRAVVAALLASNVDHVLAEIVGKLDDGRRWARWDHRRILAKGCGPRPPSTEPRSQLYKLQV